LVGDLPDGILINNFLVCFVSVYHLKDISPLQTLGDDTEAVANLVIERIFVTKNVGVLDASQNSYLIQAVCQLLFRKSRNTNLLHGVLAAIFFSFYPVDYRKGTFSQLGSH